MQLNSGQRKKILIIAGGGTIATRNYTLGGYFTNIKDLFAELYQNQTPPPQPPAFGTNFPLKHTPSPTGETVFFNDDIVSQLAMTDKHGNAILSEGQPVLPDVYFYTCFRPTGSGAFNTEVILQVCRAAYEALEGEGLNSVAILENGTYVPYTQGELDSFQNKTNNTVVVNNGILDLSTFNNRDYTYQLAASLQQGVPNILKPKMLFDGVVVTQGSVTSDETAHYLNELVYTAKPIVVTAANDARQVPGTDSYKNCLRSVQVAASEASVGKGVMLVMNNQVEYAREAIKTQLRHDAWRAGDLGSMGTCGEGPNVKIYRETTKKHGLTSVFAQEQMLLNITRKKIVADANGTSPDGAPNSFIPFSSFDIRSVPRGGEWLVVDRDDPLKRGINVLPKVPVLEADRDEPAQIIEAVLGTDTILSILEINPLQADAILLANQKIAELNSLPSSADLAPNQKLVGGQRGIPGVEGLYINGFTAYGIPSGPQLPLVNALVSQGFPICIGSRGGPNQRIALARVLTADNLNYWKALLVFRLAIKLIKKSNSLVLNEQQYALIQELLSTH